MVTRWVRRAAATWVAAPSIVFLVGCAGAASREARAIGDAPEVRQRVGPPDGPAAPPPGVAGDAPEARRPGGPADGPEARGRAAPADAGRGATSADGPATGEGPPDLAPRGPLSREFVVRAVVARSPALRERAHRVRARAAEARAAGALPPPTAMATLWQAPLRSPYVYGEGSMLMLGLQQTFPPAGARDAEARALLEEARAEAAGLAAGEREVVRQAERAFADYAEAGRMGRLHAEHGALIVQLRDVARARLSTGGTSLSDVAKAELEAARLEGEMATTEGLRARSVAELNALLGRAPGAPLAEPADEPAAAPRASLEQVRELARRSRAELTAARALARREGARGEAAEARAKWPEVTLGLNYGFMRQSGMNDTWGATAAMSLPWLSPGSGARVEAASSARAGAKAGEAASALDVEREVGEAYARARAAARQLAVLERRVLPASEGAIAAARAAYVGGPGDALAWLEALRVRLEVARTQAEARGELDRALADLDRAAGAAVPRGPFAPAEATNAD